MMAAEYIEAFQNLNVNRRGSRVAPHKAVLLLSVVDLVEAGVITCPVVEISEVLQERFRSNWRRYVPARSGFSCKLNYPFFHLASAPFWQLIKTARYEERKEYSMTALKQSFSGAAIPADLFELLGQPGFRSKIRDVLISTYLSNNGSGPLSVKNILLTAISILLTA